MIEALACGTPVVARPCGSVPEILRHGATGFIASSVDDVVAAVRKAGDLSRRECRMEFETRFTAEVMAANYERLYYQLTEPRLAPISRNGTRPVNGLVEVAPTGGAAQQ